jgi:hypothetical protein
MAPKAQRMADVFHDNDACGYGSLPSQGTTSAKHQADRASAPSIMATAFAMP